MVNITWIFVVSVTIVFMELAWSDLGVIFPGALFLCFYFTVAYGAMSGLISGAFVCIAIEFFFNRNTTALPLLVLLVLYGRIWRNLGDRRTAIPQCFSGGIIGIIYYLYTFYLENFSIIVKSFPHLFPKFIPLIATIVTSAFIYPLLIYILDQISLRLGLNTFSMQSRIQYKT